MHNENITLLLQRWNNGERDAFNQLIPLVYQGLYDRARKYMRTERKGHTLSSTALVNELFLKLVHEQERTWQNREHFFAVAATIMRHLLLHYAEARNTQKRGADVRVFRIEDVDELPDVNGGFLLRFDEALEVLREKDAEMAGLMEMRYIVGLSLEELAEMSPHSLATIKRRLKFARVWIRKYLKRGEP